MAVTHIRHMYQGLQIHCCWVARMCSHMAPRKRKRTINSTYLRATYVSVTQTQWHVPSGGWYLCSNIQLRRRQGFVMGEDRERRGGCWGEWLRVWYGVQWWRRDDTADSLSCFLCSPLLLPWNTWVCSRKRMVVVIRGGEERRTEEERRRKQGKEMKRERRNKDRERKENEGW